MKSHLKFISIVIFILFVISSSVVAQSKSYFDIEADPFAYGLNGYSLHVGYNWDSYRFALGTFGLTLPASVHRQKEFDADMKGFGYKIDWFPSADGKKWFLGTDGGLLFNTYTLKETKEEKEKAEFSAGIRFGYRWATGLKNLYLSPWIGLGYTFNADDIHIGNETFEKSALQPFPTVHIGYTF